MGFQKDWAMKEWFAQLLQDQGTEDSDAYFAHKANAYQQYRHNKILNFIQTMEIPFTKDRLLDIGCAGGDLTDRISKNVGFKHATGVDFIPELVCKAKTSFPDLEFKVAELPYLNTETDQFNMVVASEVLYYLTDDGRRMAINEIHRTLKKGGVFIIGSTIGYDYFSMESVIQLVSEKMKVVQYAFDHQKVYHFVTKPFYISKRIDQFITKGDVPGSEHSKKLLERYGPLLNLSAVRAFLRFGGALSPIICANRLLPPLCDSLGRIFFPKLTKSNITIAAVKE